jgi:SAM-dependent methyltransferase
MDQQTINTYEDNAEDFLQQYPNLLPERIYDLITTFFHKEGRTLDIGCASGRDLEYLQKQEYYVEGVEAVKSFVDHCSGQLPSIPVYYDSLPYLKTIQNQEYDNILLSAVFMHIPEGEIIESVINVLKITKVRGRIVVSTRKAAESSSDREPDGRLFNSIPSAKLISLFESFGGKLLFSESHKDNERSNITWDNFVFEKYDLTNKSGIEKIQEIIVKDKKDTSYKFALIRALVNIARYENGLAIYSPTGDIVSIPLKRVAFHWLKYYFPLLKGEVPIRQSRTHNNLGFQSALQSINYSSTELSRLVTDFEGGKNYSEINRVLKKIGQTIKDQPMRYIGDEHYGVFQYTKLDKDSELTTIDEFEHGLVHLPASIWTDMMLYGHWIEDSLLIQWAKLTERINEDERFADYLKLLSSPVDDPRNTNEVRKLFGEQPIECVWTNTITKKYEVDHAIPYSAWKNNDLWNLLPSASKINNSKSDRIPHPDLVQKRKDAIIHYWKVYADNYPHRFRYQLQKSMGVQSKSNWEKETFLGFQEIISRLFYHKIVDVWMP